MNFFNNIKLNKYQYVYARTYLYEYLEAFKIHSLTNNSKDVVLVGVPDDVYYQADMAFSLNNIMRLHYCSDEPLNDHDLQYLDSIYGKNIYPIINKINDNFIDMILVDVLPGINFYSELRPRKKNSETLNECSNLSKFIEYKFLNSRNVVTNIFYYFDSNGKIKYRNLILPKDFAQLVLIMPQNFQRTSLKSGFFRWPNNLTIRIYSKCILSAKTDIIKDDNLISVIDTYDKISNKFMKSILFRLGFSKIYILDKKIIAEDNLLIAVIGDIDHFYNLCS